MLAMVCSGPQCAKRFMAVEEEREEGGVGNASHSAVGIGMKG